MPATPVQRTAVCSLTVALIAGSAGAAAHTLFQTPQVDEGTRTYNNVVIGHGCAEDAPVIGTSVVFPDGVDSTLSVDGEASPASVTDFVANWGNAVQLIQSNDIFALQDVKTDPLGNVVGFWAGAGALEHHLIGLVPFRTNAIVIEPTSCARSVTFEAAIVDVCVVTPLGGFSEASVNLWTPSAGSNFDGAESEPARLTVNRTSALPAECGEGLDVVVTPSGAQLNRDMPVIFNGRQVWPQL
jgi:hypothetical protein